MKITKKGKLPETELINGKCQTCGTEFECEKHEAAYTFDQRDGNFYQIACPLCGRTVTIYP